MKVVAKSRLRELRILRGFTASDIANEIGVSKQLIGQLERGVNGTSPGNAKKIVEFLNVDFDEIFQIVKRGE